MSRSVWLLTASPAKPGILASNLLHWLKTKADHPEVTENLYWEENRLPVLSYWAMWSRSPALSKTLNGDPAWQGFSDKVNAEIERGHGLQNHGRGGSVV